MYLNESRRSSNKIPSLKIEFPQLLIAAIRRWREEKNRCVVLSHKRLIINGTSQERRKQDEVVTRDPLSIKSGLTWKVILWPLESRLHIDCNVQSDPETMQQIFNWKKLGFSSVNLLEILHASTYDILLYTIYKVKKPAAARPRPPAAAQRALWDRSSSAWL